MEDKDMIELLDFVFNLNEDEEIENEVEPLNNNNNKDEENRK